MAVLLGSSTTSFLKPNVPNVLDRTGHLFMVPSHLQLLSVHFGIRGGTSAYAKCILPTASSWHNGL